MTSYKERLIQSRIEKLGHSIIAAVTLVTEKSLPPDIVRDIVSSETALSLAEDNKLKDLNIQVWLSADKFAQRLCLIDHLLEHSWAGDRSTKESGSLIYGDVTFGLDMIHEYSNNGQPSSPRTELEDPDFDMNRYQVVLIHRIECDTFNGNNYHDEKLTLLIYIPS